MLKRNDLAKQFELVVQQEIKNYQDSLNFVLQSLNEIREMIKVVQEESLANHALIHSQQSYLASELNNLILDFKTEKQKLKSHINDFESYKKVSTDFIFKNTDSISLNYRINESNKNCIGAIYSKIFELEDEIAGHSLTLQNSIETTRYSLSKDFKRMKEEILSMPSDSVQVKKDLEEKISTHTVDVAGIMQELRIYKHENMVTQKKIENIYTLIERLKKAELIT